ncbi:hypothetical protein ScPMuIL_013819 [Solemya velum]
MFTPRGTVTRSRSSPFTPTPQVTRSSAKSNKRVSGLFTPQSRRTSMGFGKTPGNRSLQTSQVLEETGQHRIESFGTPLPVLITEALTLADKNTEVTVKINPSGWAWLVGGRKLFVWRYKPGNISRSVLCKELTLPPSDLAHNASRVCVITNSSDSQSASCVAVSPEGVVRYWPNIAYESSSVEISAELKGEECHSVINFAPFGCLLATTTSFLALLSPVPGQNTLTCHPLKAAQGMFAGIGRRMSSFIFGAAPSSASGAPLQAIIAGEEEEDGEEERGFYVLSGNFLQRWNVSSGFAEKLLYQIDVDRMFREGMARKIWEQDSIQMTQLKTWLLDVQLLYDGVMVLGAAVNLEALPTLHYALAVISMDMSESPTCLQTLTVLDHTERYEEHLESQLIAYKLLLPTVNTSTFYIYDSQTVIAVTSSQPLELQSPGGSILGAGSCDGVAVFFSSNLGLFSVISTLKQEASIIEEDMQDIAARADMSALAASSSQIMDLSRSEDKSSRLKAAFLMAIGGNVRNAQSIVDEMFPLAADRSSLEMDRLITALSKDLIDDYPASDPRWAEAGRQDSTSGSTSLIILQQLKDKQKAHDYIITFLKKLGLWDRLRTIKVQNGEMSTRLLLCEHAEKLEAAILLRELYGQYNVIIDAAVRKVLEGRGELGITRNLTPQDIFFREVSRVGDMVECLHDYAADVLGGDLSLADIILVVSTANAVLEGMLHGALQYRQSKAHVYQNETENSFEPEYIPWTSAGGPRGIRTILLKQYSITLEQGIPDVQDVETQSGLFQQLLSLVDIILDGYSSQLESLRQNPTQEERYEELQRRYEQDRHRLIAPFLEYDQFERAASLAEKYYDFEILIRLCEKTDNQDRVQRYISQFADQGFSNFLFTWYLKEGKRGKLLSLPVSQHTNLSRFLESSDLGYLSWLHDIKTKDYRKAHLTLLDQTQQETGLLAKKKTLLSLSKLAALASEDEDQSLETNITDINDEQNLILHQEMLPLDLVKGLGLDPETMRVLTPVELIELYISDQNISATEFDFKKALDLLQYIDKEDPVLNYNELHLHIWVKAVLRDGWLQLAHGNPLELIKDTIFFKTVDLAYTEGEI